MSEELLKTGLLELNLEVNSSILDKLNLWLDLLNKWNKVHNLTAIKKREEQIKLHIFDSASCISCLENAQIIADVGTGAGLPALIWAVFLKERKFFLIESNKKKVAFLREAKRLMALDNVEIMPSRVEDIKKIEGLDLIVSRAVSSSYDFLKMVEHLVLENSRIALMKSSLEADFIYKNFQKIKVLELKVPYLEASRIWVEYEFLT